MKRIRHARNACLLAVIMPLLARVGAAAGPQIRINHLGYDVRDSKRLVVQSAAEIELTQFQVLDAQGRVAFEGPRQKVGTMAR